MHYLFYLGHPAHFHLFKNVIRDLEGKGHQISITCKEKDILVDLLTGSGFAYSNLLPEGRNDTKIGIFSGMIKRDFRAFKLVRKYKPDLLVGTSVENSHLTRLLGIPSVNFNEDDAAVVPLYARFSYPWSSVILSPNVCDNGRWNYKTIKYSGYHELAYLHPNNFKPEKKIVMKYFNPQEKYFILRFAKLKAHHDFGAKGIDFSIAKKIIKILSRHGKVYITSEIKLDSELEQYRILINPLNIHHVLAFAGLYIGDSQTMAAEAGVLGTPFIRYNDFAGRIGYLDDLENNYNLGFSIKPGNEESLLTTVKELVSNDATKQIFAERRKKMLSEKIDVLKFMVWFLENYPESQKIIAVDPDFQQNFV
jgi:uncharacterized protein